MSARSDGAGHLAGVGAAYYPMSMPKRPRDANLLGKLIVDLATGNAPPSPEDRRDPAAVAHGRIGGLKGGQARAQALSRTERAEIARKAAQARWKK